MIRAALIAALALPAVATAAAPTPDSTPPKTTITAHPKAKTKSRTAHFAFSSSEPGSSICRLDGAAASPCAPPHTVNVKRGGHVFTVAAIDTAENIDSTPAEYSWKVRKRTDRR